MTQTDTSTVEIEPTERRPPGPWVWTLSGVLLTSAALASGTGALLRWIPCFEGGFGTEACGWLQGDQSGPWSEDVLSPVLTTSAGLVGVGYVLAGLATIVLPVLTRWVWWLGAVACFPAFWSIAEGSALMTRHLGGWVAPWTDLPGLAPLGLVGAFALLVLAVMVVLAGASRRVAVLSLGLFAGGLGGVILDFFAWSAVYGSHDDPPGSGLLSAMIMLAAGIALVVTRHRAWLEPQALLKVTYPPAEFRAR